MKTDDGIEKSPATDEERLVHHVKYEWEHGYQYLDEDNRHFDTVYSMLRGKRPDKHYDWQSNVVINKVFQIVWTTIPYVMQKIFGASPVVGVSGPEGKGDRGADDRQKILEFWHSLQPANASRHIPFKLIVILWWLRALLNGVGIVKKSWHQTLKTKTTKINASVPTSMGEDGNPVMEPHESTRRTSHPVEDWPLNSVVNNRDIVVDWLLEPGQSIRQGRFAIHRIVTDLNELQTSRINYINLEKINVDQNRGDTESDQDHAQNRHIDGQETPPDSDIYTEVEMYEREGIFPVYKEKVNGAWKPCWEREDVYNGDAIFKHMILTVVPKSNIPIRFEPNPYGEITYLDFHIYLDPERWKSMGQIEPIKDLTTALNDNINAAFDEIWQNLFAPVVVNKYALWDWDTMVYAPHQRWLVGGSPDEAIKWKEPSNITVDAWQKHQLLNTEIDLTSSVTPPMQGLGKEKAATTNVMNAQMSAGKLDFLIAMFELTGLIPSCQMDVRFAKKFAHDETLSKILGHPFHYLDSEEEVYRYTPAASSVKLEHQKTLETQEDLQLLQVVSNLNNPNAPKILNMILANIFRNRDWPKPAEMLDEKYFEPKGASGEAEMLNRMAGAESNEQGISMSEPEKNTRRMGMTSPFRVQ